MTQPVQADASTFDDVAPAHPAGAPLTRARSNLLLLLVALIWGSASCSRWCGAGSPTSFPGLPQERRPAARRRSHRSR